MGGKGQYLLTLWAGLHVLYSGQCKVMGKVFLIHFFGACEGEDCWPKEKRKEEGAHIRNHVHGLPSRAIVMEEMVHLTRLLGHSWCLGMCFLVI